MFNFYFSHLDNDRNNILKLFLEWPKPDTFSNPDEDLQEVVQQTSVLRFVISGRDQQVERAKEDVINVLTQVTHSVFISF